MTRAEFTRMHDAPLYLRAIAAQAGAHKCKCHGTTYTRCQCGHEYCPQYWPAGCPRCAERRAPK